MTLAERVRQTIEQYQMLVPGESVVVGVSGGADSMALLHVLLELQKSGALPVRVLAAHVQHNLRGEESHQDEEYVRLMCREWGVKLFVEDADVAGEAARRGTGLEETGREIRYTFFQKIASQHVPCRIATAHNRRDHMETVLLHLTRGSGLSGCEGISPVRGRIIRPLLFCSREEIERYCREKGIAFRQDSSNRDMAYSRNRIRQEVVPSLMRINPQAEEAFLRFSESVREDNDCLEQMGSDLAKCAAAESHGYHLSVLLGAPWAVCVRALRQIAAIECCPALEADHIRQLHGLIEEGRGSITLPGGRQVYAAQGRLWFCPKEAPAPPSQEIGVAPGGTYEFCGKTLSFSILSLEEYEKEKKINKILLKNALDYAMIGSSLSIRPRRPGDAYKPVGRPTKTLKRLFSEAGLPLWEREQVPVLCDRSAILWVAGFGCAQHAAVTPKTRYVLTITVEEQKNP